MSHYSLVILHAEVTHQESSHRFTFLLFIFSYNFRRFFFLTSLEKLKQLPASIETLIIIRNVNITVYALGCKSKEKIDLCYR